MKVFKIIIASNKESSTEEHHVYCKHFSDAVEKSKKFLCNKYSKLYGVKRITTIEEIVELE